MENLNARGVYFNEANIKEIVEKCLNWAEVVEDQVFCGEFFEKAEIYRVVALRQHRYRTAWRVEKQHIGMVVYGGRERFAQRYFYALNISRFFDFFPYLPWEQWGAECIFSHRFFSLRVFVYYSTDYLVCQEGRGRQAPAGNYVSRRLRAAADYGSS